MAAIKILTSAGLFLAFCALVLLAMAICTDYWYETDARRHRERCKNYANKRNDPGYIYISNHNLPLQMPPKGYERKATEARVRRHAPASATAMESHCSRQFNSTISGLWRKCHREGFDLETEDLIYKDHLVFESGMTVEKFKAALILNHVHRTKATPNVLCNVTLSGSVDVMNDEVVMVCNHSS